LPHSTPITYTLPENLNPSLPARLKSGARLVAQNAMVALETAALVLTDVAQTGAEYATNSASTAASYLAHTNLGHMTHRRVFEPFRMGLNSLANSIDERKGDLAGVIAGTSLDAPIRRYVALPPAFVPGGNSLVTSNSTNSETSPSTESLHPTSSSHNDVD
jgi:hypothetical protein